MNSRISVVWPVWHPWKPLPPKTVTLVIVTLTIFVKSQTKIVEASLPSAAFLKSGFVRK